MMFYSALFFNCSILFSFYVLIFLVFLFFYFSFFLSFHFYYFQFLNFSVSFCWFFSFHLFFFYLFRFFKQNQTKIKCLTAEITPNMMIAERWHTHVQQQYFRLNDAKNPNISFSLHERPWDKYNLIPYKKSLLSKLPRFHVIST